MIYVNEQQLNQVEYLIEQSSRGHHILFDIQMIRKAFGGFSENELPLEDQGTIEKHIENLILQPSILSKKEYLSNLDADVFKNVVCTYFAIVENTVFQAQKFPQ